MTTGSEMAREMAEMRAEGCAPPASLEAQVEALMAKAGRAPPEREAFGPGEMPPDLLAALEAEAPPGALGRGGWMTREALFRSVHAEDLEHAARALVQELHDTKVTEDLPDTPVEGAGPGEADAVWKLYLPDVTAALMAFVARGWRKG